jgi:hypothetical protein
MRIWPAGSILVLETKPDLASFPVSTLFAGEWSYQSFSVEGKVLPAPEGASACHQCHSTAFSVTGDLVFTLFSQNEAIEKDQK